jgi:hypothetical protein
MDFVVLHGVRTCRARGCSVGSCWVLIDTFRMLRGPVGFVVGGCFTRKITMALA